MDAGVRGTGLDRQNQGSRDGLVETNHQKDRAKTWQRSSRQTQEKDE